MKSITVLRSNDVNPDPRVEKTAKWLTEEGYKVTVLCWDRERGSLKHEIRDGYTIMRCRIPSRYGGGLRNIFPMFLFNMWLFFKLIFLKHTDLIHACDLDTAITGLIISRLRRKKIIFDVFDLHSEAHFATASPAFRRIVKFVEKFVMEKSDAVILVDETRIQQIEGVRPRVLEFIYNVPDLEPNDSNSGDKSGWEHKESGRVIIGYVGVLQDGRMLEQLVDFVCENENVHLMIAGFGKLDEFIYKRSLICDRIKFFGKVSYKEAMEIYKKCDAIFAAYDPSVPNHRYSSPNKVFEAMALGKPVIVARGTSIDKLVRENGLGFVIEYGSKEDLKMVVSRIMEMSTEEISERSQLLRKLYREKYSAEKMRKRLLRLYSKVLEKSP